MEKQIHSPEISYRIDGPEVIYSLVLETRYFAEKMGFKTVQAALIATAVSELATNILRYADVGSVTIKELDLNKSKYIEVIAADKGPGIPDIQLAMQEKFSTKENSLGLGLSSVQRIMDEFHIESTLNVGTTIRTLKEVPHVKN